MACSFTTSMRRGFWGVAWTKRQQWPIGLPDSIPRNITSTARLAEKQKRFKLAEDHYHMAVELAPQDPGRLIDLAEFLESQTEAADRAFDQAHDIGPRAPVVLFEQDRIYIRSGRRLDNARAILLRYLSLTTGPDEPPRSEALKVLQRLPTAPPLNAAK